MRGLHHVAWQPKFEAKGSDESRNGIGSRWGVVSGGRRARGPAGDAQVQNTPPPVISLDEEEISDVSLSTFYVFDHEKRWSTSSRLTTRSEDA